MTIFLSLCKKIWNNHLRRKQGSCPALSFSAHLKNCNVATCGHMLAHWTQRTQFSPTCIHSSNRFNRSIKFFHLKIALDWSWANLDRCLRNHPKTLVSTYACFGGKDLVGTLVNLHKAPWSKTRTLSGRDFVFLCRTDKLQATCWHILLSKHSLFHSSFIQELESVFYQVLSIETKPRAGRRRILAFVTASTEKHSRLDLSPCVLRPEYITFARNTDAVWKRLL